MRNGDLIIFQSINPFSRVQHAVLLAHEKKKTKLCEEVSHFLELMVYLSHFALLMLADAEKMAELDNLFIAGVKICAEKRNRRAFIRKELDRREANWNRRTTVRMIRVDEL